MSNQAKTFENTDSELDSLYALNEHQQVRLKTRIDVAMKVRRKEIPSLHCWKASAHTSTVPVKFSLV